MTRQQATGLVLLGGIFMSFVGVLLRQIDMADAFQILFYRSIGLSAIVAVLACLHRRSRPGAFLASLGRPEWFAGVLLGFAFSFYIYSMLNTTVANTLFILSIAPFFAALLGWCLIGERPTIVTWLAMGLAVTGVGLMVYDGFTGGRLAGNIFALASALCFAGMLVIVRRSRRSDMLGGAFTGGLVAMVLNGVAAVAFGAGLAVSVHDFGLSLAMGAFTIGIGIALVTWGAAHLPAAEVAILVLIESVLGPLWVWLIFGETSSAFVIAGGAIVLASVIFQASFGRYRTATPGDTAAIGR